MRRASFALFSAVALLVSFSAAPSPASGSTVGRPRVAVDAPPAKGIALTLGFANEITDARAMSIADSLMPSIATKFHANAVSLNFPYWESSWRSDYPQRAPMTPSPQRLMAITEIAHRYHLAVQWRPFLYENDLVFHSHNSIVPTNPAQWLRNYWTFLQPYLVAANLAGASSFSIALELPTLLPYLSAWTTIVRRAKSLYSGELLYSQQHRPQVSIPLTVRGYDAYQPIYLSSESDVSVNAFTTGFERNLRSSEMNSTPADLTIEEVSIPAVSFAYLRPADFAYAATTPIVRRVQTDWFEAACNAFWQLHLRGIYYYAIAFNRYTASENQSDSWGGWLGTSSARAIASCFARTSSQAPARPSVAGPAARGAPAVWGAPQLVEPTGGHPSSVSCPEPGSCVEVDLGGDALTEVSGTWGRPSRIDTVGLTSVSCATTTFCVAVDGAGNTFTYDGSGWTEMANVDPVALTSVSCAPGSTTCVAGDVAGDAVTDSSGTWSAPEHVSSSPLSAVACATSTYCVAVDTGGDAATYTSSWSATQRLGSAGLTAVTCPEAGTCVAGDDDGHLYREASGSWRTLTGGVAGGVVSVSCTSPSSCLALGSQSSVAIRGTAATSPPTALLARDEGVALSCAPSGLCTAASYGGSVVLHASSWGHATTVDPRPGLLTGVGCGSTTFCTAIDDAGEATVWNGTTWSALSPTGLASLSGVSCAGAFCMAVSNSGGAVAYEGGSWGRPRVVDPSPLTAISCVSSSFCAVTDASKRVLFFSNGAWSKPNNEGVDLTHVRGYTAVSCATPEFCVAVDTYGEELFFGKGVHAFRHQADTYNVPLTGVSCAAVGWCVAVDEQGRELTFRASGSVRTWSPPAPIDAYRLTAVSCTAAGYCLATDDDGGTTAFADGSWGAASLATPLQGTIGSVACVATTCAATTPTEAAFATVGP